MSTSYTLRAGPTTGRIDATGIADLGVYEIEDSRIHVDDYDAACTLVDHFNHVEWLGDETPDAPDGDDGDEQAADESDDSDADPDPDDDGDVADDDAGDADDDAADGDDGAADDAVDLESLDYREVQDIAGEYDDIRGNQSREDLIAALREHPDFDA